jgi:transcriptional regulator with XRE-family HTH domain
MVTWKEVGRRIESARTDAGVSQGGLADIIGVHPSAVSRIESGERKIDSLELAGVADAVGRPVWWFLDERPTASALFAREESSGEQARRQAVVELEILVSDLAWLRSIGG